MELQNIAFDKLSVSTLNMRHGKSAPDITDILPSIRARGVLVPLLVRPKAEPPDTFEIVAGRRRWFSVKTLLAEGGEADPLPCAIMAPGDDAAALEASLIENIARLDPDEVSCWETFTRLIATEGRTPDQIAQTFGVTDLYVKRVLALGNLLPRLRSLYRSEDIDTASIRHLTMATKAQQKAWLKLYDSEDEYPPTGTQLKSWLFGGGAISTKVAIFPLDLYTAPIITDLFGDDGYFSDADLFWTLQNGAIAAKSAELIDAGWPSVELLDMGEPFYTWTYTRMPKDSGGRVYISLSIHGEVEIHEGFLPAKEAQKVRAAQGTGE